MIRSTILLSAAVAIPLLLVAQRPQLIVTTDIGQDPDDEQSMVRLLHYANDFALLGLVVNADANNDYEPPVLRADLLHNLIDAYAKIVDNLRVHDARFPTARDLHALVKAGCAGNSVHRPVEEYVGEGMNTEGSAWIVDQLRQAEGPVYVAVWGGGADLAQALWSAQRSSSAPAFVALQQKLRVYFIGKQDTSVDWILENHPAVQTVVALDPDGDKWRSTYRGMFLGGDLSLTSRGWLDRYVYGQSPLADLYPPTAYTGGPERNPYAALKEGDTPSLLHFIPNGLNDPEHPEWGGWGGRFRRTGPNRYTDTSDSLHDGSGERSQIATVHRWRLDFQRDFAARIAWGATGSPSAANHHPRVTVTTGTQRIDRFLTAEAGSVIDLSAAQSQDPDGDALDYHWMIYPEAGNLPGAELLPTPADSAATVRLRLPVGARVGQSVHLVVSVTDRGSIPLTAYRRMVVTIAREGD